jgi:hypothetical protein
LQIIIEYTEFANHEIVNIFLFQELNQVISVDQLKTNLLVQEKLVGSQIFTIQLHIEINFTLIFCNQSSLAINGVFSEANQFATD